MGSTTLEEMVSRVDGWWKRLEYVRELYTEWVSGEIEVKPPRKPTSYLGFLSSPGYVLWFYVLLLLMVATVALVYLSNIVPLLRVPRYLLGSLYVLFIPGYALLQALYEPGELSPLEELALSIGLSLALVPLIGLILNYTPWGIRLTPVVITLSITSTAFSLLATYRRYRYYSKRVD